MSRLIFADWETTGVSGVDTLPLELGVVVTDADFNEVGRNSWVIRQTQDQLDNSDLDSFVIEMHERNGLLEEVLGPGALSLSQVSLRLHRFLQQTCGSPGEVKYPLAGSSLWLDVTMFKIWLPRIYETWFHHRTLDVSVVKAALENYSGVDFPEHLDGPHRALFDCEESIQLAKTCASILRRIGEQELVESL